MQTVVLVILMGAFVGTVMGGMIMPEWKVLSSDITGNCYEMRTTAWGFAATEGMAQIDPSYCEEK